MTWRVTTVMHDTADLAGAVEFWTTLLDLDVVYRNEAYAYLSPMSSGGPHLAFQQVPEVRTSKNRLHLDIQVPDRTTAEERVVGMGGAKLREVDEPGFPKWSVMADPEGNEFCVYDKSEPD